MRVVIYTHPGVSRLRRILNRLHGLPPQTCHIEYEIDDTRRWGQIRPLTECLICGRLHPRRPVMSETQVDSVIGGRMHRDEGGE